MRLLIAVLLMLSMSPAMAHEQGGSHEHQVVPVEERDIARRLRARGPEENSGIRAVDQLGSLALTGELANPDERQMRVREITIEPGGVVAVHQHQRRPGMAYILEGRIVEHRNDREEPVTREQGAVSFEKTGVTHWWENRSEEPVRALVVDIVPLEQSPQGGSE